mgnify:FL=1
MVGHDGRVRVVDFGLAHAAAEARSNGPDGRAAADLGASTPGGLTATGALTGTPAYMAPEQYLGQPTDARTDVFAFCVALYEHLHGRRPFSGDTLASLAESVLSSELPEPPPGVRVPVALRRLLLRGLAAAPADRYPSMEALLAELDRVIVPPRRRALSLAGGALGFAAAAAVAAVALSTSDRAEARCRQSADEFAEVWSTAAREAGARAFAASGLPYAQDTWTRATARLDEWTATWADARRDACLEAARGEVSQALADRRAGCFDRQRARLDALLDVFAGADAKIVERGGEAVASLPDPRECSTAAMSDLSDGPPPPPPDRAAAVDALRRRLAAADMRFRATYTEEALAALDDLLEEARALGERTVIAEVAAAGAEAYMSLVRADPAEERFLEALGHAEAVGDTRRVAAIWPRWIKFLTRERSAYAEAKRAERRADALLERVGGDEQILFAIHEARAQLAAELDDDDRARREYAAALALGDRLFGPGALRLADLHNNFGGVLARRGDPAARAQIDRAFEIWTQKLGPDHPKLAYATFNLARAAAERQDIREAERLYRAVLERFERIDPDHPHIGPVLSNIASAREYVEGPERALEVRLRALEQSRRNAGPEHRFTAQAYLFLGTTEQGAGRFDDAREHLERGLEIDRKLFGPQGVETRLDEARLLDLLIDRGEPDKARALADDLLAWLDASPDRGSTDFALLHALIARSRLDDGRHEEAQDLAERALRADPATALASFVLARALLVRGGDLTRVRALADAALREWSRWPLKDPRRLHEAQRLRAELDRRAPPG